MRYEVRGDASATPNIRAFARYLRRSAGAAIARTNLTALEHDLENTESGARPKGDCPRSGIAMAPPDMRRLAKVGRVRTDAFGRRVRRFGIPSNTS
jgi:hypothetical protein